MSVGYPIGLDDENYCRLEILGGSIVHISVKDYFFWRDVHKIKQLSHEQLEKCAELRDLGLLTYEETPEELFPLILDFSPMRQGAGWWDNKRERPCVMFQNGGLTFPNNIAYSIWESSECSP